MKKQILAFLSVSAAALTAPMAQAASAEYAKVISSKPVYQKVATKREVCRDETVTSEVPGSGTPSGVGAVLGGIAGAALGNQVGEGSGKTIATVVGGIGGAILGDNVQGSSTPQTESRVVRKCYNEPGRDRQLAGYEVEYEYGGKTFMTYMSRDPGRRVEVQVVPVGAIPTPSNLWSEHDYRRDERMNRRDERMDRRDDRYDRRDERLDRRDDRHDRRDFNDGYYERR